MSIVSPDSARTRVAGLPLLVNGNCMAQAEFHCRYREYPGDDKFELVGGIVYKAPPLSITHSDYDDEIGFLLGLYRRATPGVQVLQNATTILGEESEPQPDRGLRILPDYGGRSSTSADNYVQGAPELVVEIAHSRRALDMHGKRDDYRQAGVVAYLIVCVEEQELHWLDFATGRPLRPNREGVYRSRVFPGLWIEGGALLGCDSTVLRSTLDQGLASRAHAAFVKRLQAAHRRT